MGEWKQGKCGWPVKGTGRPCTRPTMKGTSRCWQHQGAWTKYEMRRKAAEEQRKANKSRKK
jgi:hypothetical protein